MCVISGIDTQTIQIWNFCKSFFFFKCFLKLLSFVKSFSLQLTASHNEINNGVRQGSVVGVSLVVLYA